MRYGVLPADFAELARPLVARRYREWHALFASLPTSLRAEIEAAGGPFPPKRLHIPALTCMWTEHVDERTEGLAVWAKALVLLPHARERPEVRAFFEV